MIIRLQKNIEKKVPEQERAIVYYSPAWAQLGITLVT